MKITRKHLRQLINEEISTINEFWKKDDPKKAMEKLEAQLQNAMKVFEALPDDNPNKAIFLKALEAMDGAFPYMDMDQI